MEVVVVVVVVLIAAELLLLVYVMQTIHVCFCTTETCEVNENEIIKSDFKFFLYCFDMKNESVKCPK